MRSWCPAGAVTVVLAFLLTACGQTSPITPVSPSRPVEATFPSIVGDWLASATVTMINRADNTVTGTFACIQTWSFNSQNGGEFSGTMNSTGENSSSDRFCTVTGGTNVTGVLKSNGAISSLRLENGLDAGGCRRLGDDAFTGQLTSATTFNLRLSDRWRCLYAAGTYDADRTVTVSATLRFR